MKTSKKNISRRSFLKLGLAVAGGALLASYPVMIERYLIFINHYKISLPRLPQEFAGFRIVHISDVHLGRLVPKAVVDYVVWQANRLARDITVCTGDYVHAVDTGGEIDVIWPALARLAAPQGVFAVLGNHDHWADTQRSLYWLERSGQSLRHKAVVFERKGKRLWLGGVGDLWEDTIDIDNLFPQAAPEEAKIVLAHNPDSADLDFESAIDLMLSGHTHGGQVRLPFVGSPVLPVRNKRYTSGLIETGRLKLFISRGIGWTVAPLRFNCPPEIAVLELISPNK
jgi:hypothetical protein